MASLIVAVPVLPKYPRPPASQPTNHEIAGYMPGRREFEHVYENDAEQIVKDLDFNEEDSAEDTGIRLLISRIEIGCNANIQCSS